MPRRQVNNIARLSRDKRLRIYSLLLDGCTYESIRQEMAASCAGIALHNTSFLACQSSAEYRRFQSAWTERQKESETYAVAAALADPKAREGASSETEDDLLQLVSRMTERYSGEDAKLDEKSLKMLTSALKDLAAIRLTTRVRKVEAEKQKLQQDLDRQVAEKDAEISRIKAQVDQLTATMEKAGISVKGADASGRLSEATMKRIKQNVYGIK